MKIGCYFQVNDSTGREKAKMPTMNEAVLLAAIQGFELQKAQIDQHISELRALLPNGNRSAAAAASDRTPRRYRHFSHEAIERMRAAQKARWAKVRGESVPSPASARPVETPKPKRRLSAAGRAAIIAGTKRRWALKRAAEAAKKSTPIKRAAVKTPSAKAAKRSPVKRTVKSAPPATAAA